MPRRFQTLARSPIITNNDYKSPQPSQDKSGTESGLTGAEPQPVEHECELIRAAQCILQRRQRRNDLFNRDIFGEPAWDMLLTLFVRDSSGASSTAVQLVTAAETAPSTGVRWLGYLEKEGLVTRRRHPLDHQTEFVELTDRARDSLERYLGDY